MLIANVERYISLRQALGYKFHDASRELRAFARFSFNRGATHVCASLAEEWAAEAPSPSSRHIRLRNIARMARFLHVEDARHEVPSNRFRAYQSRPMPYIYTPEEIVQLMDATGGLRPYYPLRREVYRTLLGLIAATGMRISEALDLRLSDVLPDGVLQIRHTKFGKSRLIPLHPTSLQVLFRYLEQRRRLAVPDDHVFLSASNRRIASSTVEYSFNRIRQLSGIAPFRSRPPRIHDLRHTFATRSLQQCSTRRDAVARHFVALATYMGHTDIAHTYWYLEATPEMMIDIAASAEAVIAKEGL